MNHTPASINGRTSSMSVSSSFMASCTHSCQISCRISGSTISHSSLRPFRSESYTGIHQRSDVEHVGFQFLHGELYPFLPDLMSDLRIDHFPFIAETLQIGIIHWHPSTVGRRACRFPVPSWRVVPIPARSHVGSQDRPFPIHR